jgi:hypothetical protein
MNSFSRSGRSAPVGQRLTHRVVAEQNQPLVTEDKGHVSYRSHRAGDLTVFDRFAILLTLI